jgi:hypothetical protein
MLVNKLSYISRVLCHVKIDKHNYDFALLKKIVITDMFLMISLILLLSIFTENVIIFSLNFVYGPKKSSIFEPIQIQSPVITTKYNKKVSTRDVLICFLYL